MRTILGGVAAILLAACGSTTASPGPIDEPLGSAPPLLPLPANVAGIPGAEDATTEVTAHSPDDELDVGEWSDFTLGHCGLGSPIDVDGSLWDPVGYRTVSGRALSEGQQGELVNSTDVVLLLVTENRLEMDTPGGAAVELSRHDGPRRYFLCD
jgi:hypothetical protein